MSTKPIDLVVRLRGAVVEAPPAVRKALLAEAADTIEGLRYWLQRSVARERELQDQLANTQPMPFDEDDHD